MNNTEKKNIRTLLSTMHTVIWAGSNWKQVGLGDLLDGKKVPMSFAH